MAAANSGDPTLLIIVIVLIIGLFGYVFLNNYLAKNRRKDLIRAFKASPEIKNNTPILVEGPATAPDHILPTTGEHVAFYGIFVLSRESAITDATGILNTGGVGKITGTKGFRFFETSGDFLVSSRGTPYLVSISGAIAYFAKGASIASSVAGGLAKSAGMPGREFDDAMGVEIAEAALRSICGFEAPITLQTAKTKNQQERTTHTTASVVTVKSHIDSRIHYFNTETLPPGIRELLAKRSIVPEGNEEIMVIETFIPLNHDVSVFGIYDGDQRIVFKDSTVLLSVSYNDPGED
jgi:hypothetical protein